MVELGGYGGGDSQVIHRSGWVIEKSVGGWLGY